MMSASPLRPIRCKELASPASPTLLISTPRLPCKPAWVAVSTHLPPASTPLRLQLLRLDTTQLIGAVVETTVAPALPWIRRAQAISRAKPLPVIFLHTILFNPVPADPVTLL